VHAGRHLLGRDRVAGGVLGERPLGLAPEQIISLSYPTGALDSGLGVVQYQYVIVAGKYCRDVTLIDASGRTMTGAGGNVTFRLSTVVCLPLLLRAVREPVNLLATVAGPRPFFATTEYAPLGNDLEITLRAWDPNGQPASEVSVHWRCRLAALLGHLD
jgi:hypothetical protein